MHLDHDHIGGGHSHSHPHTHEHPNEQRLVPMDELAALLRYMLSHNAAHTDELMDLAQQMEANGNHRAYQKVMDAIANYDVANTTLASVVDELMKSV